MQELDPFIPIDPQKIVCLSNHVRLQKRGKRVENLNL